jgi:hypothetical protein
MLCDGNVYASMLAWLRFAVGIINSNCHGWPEVVFFVREAGVVPKWSSDESVLLGAFGPYSLFPQNPLF